MKVGVPTEIKTDEYRVAITPAGVREFVEHGHDVLIQHDAGDGSVIPDDEYVAQGARIVPDARGYRMITFPFQRGSRRSSQSVGGAIEAAATAAEL